MSKTIVFIHGAWVTPACWEPFRGYFEERGYECIAPAWPGKDRPLDEVPARLLARLAFLRRHRPDLGLPEDLVGPVLVGACAGRTCRRSRTSICGNSLLMTPNAPRQANNRL